jgi:hypothetical protein
MLSVLCGLADRKSGSMSAMCPFTDRKKTFDVSCIPGNGQGGIFVSIVLSTIDDKDTYFVMSAREMSGPWFGHYLVDEKKFGPAAYMTRHGEEDALDMGDEATEESTTSYLDSIRAEVEEPYKMLFPETPAAMSWADAQVSGLFQNIWSQLF